MKTQAISNLAPNAQFSIIYGDSGNDVITWLDDSIQQPTDAEIATEVTRLQTVYDSQEYARNRKAKYDLLNQDEMRFDDLENTTTTWQDAINAIKAEYPKG